MSAAQYIGFLLTVAGSYGAAAYWLGRKVDFLEFLRSKKLPDRVFRLEMHVGLSPEISE